MKRALSVFCIFALFFSLSGCAKTESDTSLEENYEITGTEHTQMWELKYNDFLSAYNDLISDETMKLDYLKEYDPSSSNCMLTKNGESWKILLKVFTENEADASWFKNEPDAAEWVGNIESAELSLFSADTKAAEENGLYVRYLITLFTPGSEKYVEDAIGLYGDPAPEAVIDAGVNQVRIGNVLYSYTSDGRFLVEPRIDDWPAEEDTPDAIRPD